MHDECCEHTCERFDCRERGCIGGMKRYMDHIVEYEKTSSVTNQKGKPFVVNFYGGPGSGKSTTAASLFSYLKMSDVNCELVTEFAKDATWSGNLNELSYQPFVFGQQAWRIERLKGKVDVVVTDSPIILSSIYASSDMPQSFHDFVLWEHRRTNSLDFFLKRVKKYNPVGRNQSEDEAKEIDMKIETTLKTMGVNFHEVLTGDGTAAIKAFGIVMKELGK